MVDSAPPRPRRSLRLLLVGGLLLAVLVPGVVWWIGHRATLEVSAATGLPRCEGTEVTTTKRGSGIRQPAIVLTEGFECIFTIRVTNDGGRSVDLGTISFPVAGPGAGSGYRITTIGQVEVRRGDQVEAEVDLDSSVAPGADHRVDIRVVFRDDGCVSKGTASWGQATVEVGRLLTSRQLRVADLPVFLGTADSSCDS